MGTKRRIPGFWEPSVFFWEDRDQWAVEYLETDAETGRHRKARKTFLKELKAQGRAGSHSEQKDAANAFKAARSGELRQEKKETHLERRQTKLSRDKLNQAKAAFAIFDQIPYRDKSLVEAVNQYRQNLKLAVDSPQLATCVKIFLGHKETAANKGSRSFATVRTLKQRLNNFVSYFKGQGRPEIKIGDVTAKEIIAYLDSRGSTARTGLNYAGDLANFFNDASNPKDPHRLLNLNPMHEVGVHYGRGTTPRTLRGRNSARKTPRILQIEEVKFALQLAVRSQEAGVLGFVVAGFFLGMRPSEILDMTKLADFWSTHLKLDDRMVIIDHGLGKIGDRRNIAIKDNAYLWLRYLHDNKLPLSYDDQSKAGRKAFSRFRARAFLGETDGNRILKLRRKPKMLHTPEDRTFLKGAVAKLKEREDVFRHCFGTNFYYACNFDKNQTVHEMGNSVAVFITHYRGILQPADSYKEYWNLKPSDFGLV
ncbi:MAG: hypothetical protein NTV51_10305 [Verrucomicrobia bacterium]|nr:hypothetical protein [Verrucomicrobiota bacterium]